MLLIFRLLQYRLRGGDLGEGALGLGGQRFGGQAVMLSKAGFSFLSVGLRSNNVAGSGGFAEVYCMGLGNKGLGFRVTILGS